MQKTDKNVFPLKRNIVPSNFHVEIDKTARGISLSCSGVRGITEFSNTEIKLQLSEFSMLICGNKLLITVFEERSVEIIGKITEVKFLYGKI